MYYVHFRQCRCLTTSSRVTSPPECLSWCPGSRSWSLLTWSLGGWRSWSPYSLSWSTSSTPSPQISPKQRVCWNLWKCWKNSLPLNHDFPCKSSSMKKKLHKKINNKIFYSFYLYRIDSNRSMGHWLCSFCVRSTYWYVEEVFRIKS